MATLASLTVDIKGDASSLVGTLSQAERKTKDFGESARSSGGLASGLGRALGGVATIAGGFVVGQGISQLGGFLMDAVRGAIEDEQATARLQQSVRNLGGDYDAMLGKVNDQIAAGQKLAFSDDEVRNSFVMLAAATNDGDEALRRQTLAMDLARGANIPLETASRLLGKVTAENVEVFKRMGITIGEGADEAEAFAAIQAKFGGQAEVYAKSTAGQFAQAKIAMSEMTESIGAIVLPGITRLATVAAENLPKIQELVGDASESLAHIWDALDIDGLIDSVQAALAPVLPEVRQTIDAVGADVARVVAFFREHWSQIEPVVTPIWEQVKLVVETAIKLVSNTLQFWMNMIQGDWSGAWNNVKAQGELIWGLIKGSLDNAGTLWEAAMIAGMELVKAAARAGLDLLIAEVKLLPGQLLELQALFNRALIALGEALIDGIKAGVEAAARRLADAAVSAVQGALDAVKDKLKIFSPSAVWRDEVGLPIMEGLGLGLDEGFGRYVAPALARAGSALALSPAETGPAFGRGGGFMTAAGAGTFTYLHRQAGYTWGPEGALATTVVTAQPVSVAPAAGGPTTIASAPTLEQLLAMILAAIKGGDLADGVARSLAEGARMR